MCAILYAHLIKFCGTFDPGPKRPSQRRGREGIVLYRYDADDIADLSVTANERVRCVEVWEKGLLWPVGLHDR